MQQVPQILKQLPTITLQLNRKLALIHHMYGKYKVLKDEITNKQIEYMLANQGILTGELEPNPEAYIREYETICQQSSVACAYLSENEATIDQCLNLIEEVLTTLQEQREETLTISKQEDWESSQEQINLKKTKTSKQESKVEPSQSQEYSSIKNQSSGYSSSKTTRSIMVAKKVCDTKKKRYKK